jgi:RNA polymerase sigma factor (TIGR02999 family)
LWGLVYDEMRSMAALCLNGGAPGHTLQPTALVHEAYLRLVDESKSTFENKAHFMAVAAKVMRGILVDHARAQGAQKRGGGMTRVALHEELVSVPTSAGSDVDVLALDDVLGKLGALDERLARVVELRFFGGLTIEQVAHALGVARSTVTEDWRIARAWVVKELGSRSVGE